MTDRVQDLGGVRVLEIAPDGAKLTRAGDALDFVGAAWAHHAALVAIPVQRLADDFFRLRTGFAGEAIQKFVTYRIRLAIVGDITRFIDASVPLRDFVNESNRGDHVWFVADIAALEARLAR